MLITSDGIRTHRVPLWLAKLPPCHRPVRGLGGASIIPEDSAIVGHFNWDSTEGAKQNGLLTAEYATEWADYLKANDCTYIDRGC